MTEINHEGARHDPRAHLISPFFNYQILTTLNLSSCHES